MEVRYCDDKSKKGPHAQTMEYIIIIIIIIITFTK